MRPGRPRWRSTRARRALRSRCARYRRATPRAHPVVIPTFSGDLLVGRRPGELRLEVADRALDLTRPRPHRARHPVERSQLVDDRATDPRDRIRLELDVALRVVAVDRTHQAEQAVGDEVGLVHVSGQPRAEPAGHVLHERRVVHDQAVTQRLLAGSAVFEPEASAVGFPGHEERIRASGAFSSVLRARKRPSTRRARPTRRRLPTPHALQRRARSRRRSASAPRKAQASRSVPRPDHAVAASIQTDRRNRRLEGATEGRSSIGRAPVSKTGGCRFKSCRPCSNVGEPERRTPTRPLPGLLLGDRLSGDGRPGGLGAKRLSVLHSIGVHWYDRCVTFAAGCCRLSRDRLAGGGIFRGGRVGEAGPGGDQVPQRRSPASRYRLGDSRPTHARRRSGRLRRRCGLPLWSPANSRRGRRSPSLGCSVLASTLTQLG